MKRSASGTLNTAIGAAAAPPLPSQKASGGSAASSLRGDEDFSLSSIGVQSTVHRNLTPAELYEWALKVCRSQFFFKSLLTFLLTNLQEKGTRIAATGSIALQLRRQCLIYRRRFVRSFWSKNWKISQRQENCG
jgi:hypothetical protein